MLKLVEIEPETSLADNKRHKVRIVRWIDLRRSQDQIRQHFHWLKIAPETSPETDNQRHQVRILHWIDLGGAKARFGFPDSKTSAAWKSHQKRPLRLIINATKTEFDGELI